MPDVISEQTMNARRRVHELEEELEGVTHKLGSIMNEMQDLGIDPEILRKAMIERLQSVVVRDNGSLEIDMPIGGGIVAPMYAVIERLLHDAPKLTGLDGKPDPDQKPALECHVLLRHATQPLYGSLSKSPEGAMRMLCFANLVDPSSKSEKPVMMEHFFEVDDVVDIMVVRDVKAETSRIHRPS